MMTRTSTLLPVPFSGGGEDGREAGPRRCHVWPTLTRGGDPAQCHNGVHLPSAQGARSFPGTAVRGACAVSQWRRALRESRDPRLRPSPSAARAHAGPATRAHAPHLAQPLLGRPGGRASARSRTGEQASGQAGKRQAVLALPARSSSSSSGGPLGSCKRPHTGGGGSGGSGGGEDEVQAEPDADLRPRGLQEARRVPVLPQRARRRGAPGEQQPLPRPLDRARRGHGARGGAGRRGGARGVRGGGSQGEVGPAAGRLRAEPGPQAPDLRVRAHRHRAAGGLGRLGQHRQEARVVQDRRCHQGPPVPQARACRVPGETEAGRLPD
ncbi:diphosphoinositol polyphosphate phosphohydrolase 3-beta isoform X2 [Peromyscus californicus insignis]|uniref:diphosphoinositol polyphosphate phosphohydrolase 3-beta isoform X2 n=1 Tax=Peromyscus californicus insignis TaxID=564181 RepID=UPI0022A69A72|nr:diphosphoinositol polyphosphate phosphohydrolase 3-beta isoform X2 [Peromyscus californicus insignis]